MYFRLQVLLLRLPDVARRVLLLIAAALLRERALAALRAAALDALGRARAAHVDVLLFAEMDGHVDVLARACLCARGFWSVRSPLVLPARYLHATCTCTCASIRRPQLVIT